MLGNVWEWVEDCYADSYDSKPANGAPLTGGEGQGRVLRGGSWCYEPETVRSATRKLDRQPNPLRLLRLPGRPDAALTGGALVNGVRLD